MTEQNRRDNLLLELEKGDKSLQAARLCARASLWDDAISRAYYAAYHHVQALLLSVDLEPRSHAGAHHLFHLHIVKPGIVPRKLGKLFAGLQKYREQADCERAFLFDAEDGSEELRNAELICREIRERLEADGWLAT